MGKRKIIVIKLRERDLRTERGKGGQGRKRGGQGRKRGTRKKKGEQGRKMGTRKKNGDKEEKGGQRRKGRKERWGRRGRSGKELLFHSVLPTLIAVSTSKLSSLLVYI